MANEDGEERMKNFFIVLCILFITVSFAQAPDTLWTRTYGGPDFEGASSVHQTTDGGYIIGGGNEPFGMDTGDVYIVKTDSLGDTLWTRLHGNPNLQEWCTSIQQTTDGGYIVLVLTAIVDTSSIFFDDIVLMKLNALGDTVWVKTYGGNNEELAGSVQQTADGGYIVVAITNSFGAGEGDVFLIKTNSLGDTVWTRTYGGTGYDAASSVQQTTDGGYIIAGSTRSFSLDSGDVYVIKTASAGDTLWTRSYGGISWDWGNSVQQTTDGGYIIAGGSCSFNPTYNDDAYLIKTDSLGDTLWTRTYGGDSNDIAFSVIQLTDSGHLFVGNTYSYGAGEDDLWLVRIDTIGNILGTRTYGGTSQDGGVDIQKCTDGGYVVAGYTASFGGGFFDAWLLKIAPEPGIEEEKVEAVKYSNFGTTIFSGPLLLPEGKKCKVFDIMGRVVMLDRIKPGVYFIEVDGKITQKVVKVR